MKNKVSINKFSHIVRTAVFVYDKESKGYTGFYSHRPGVVAEGDDLVEVTNNLSKALKAREEWDEAEELSNGW